MRKKKQGTLEERFSFLQVGCSVRLIPQGLGSTNLSYEEVKQGVVEIKVFFTL